MSFLGSAVLARLLVPQDFGILAFGLTIVAFGSFLVDSGLGAVLIRSEQEPDTGTLSSVLGFQLVAMLVVTGAMFLLAAVIGKIMLIAAVMTSGLLVTALRVPSTIVLERRLKYGLLASADLADTASFTVVSVALVLAGLGVWGVTIATAVQGVIGTAIILGRGPLHRLPPTLHLSRISPLLSFGLQYQAVSLVGFVRDEGTNIFVLAISGLGTLGVVALAGRLVLGITLVFESIWRVSYPAMAQVKRVGTDPRGPLDAVSRYTGLGAAAVVVAFASLLPGSLTIVFGMKWNDVLIVLPGMLAGLFVVGPVSVACAGYLYAEGNAKTVLISAIAHTAVAWAFLGLLPVWGLPVISYGAFAVCAVEAAILGRGAFRRSGWNAGRALARIWAVGGSVAILAWTTASSLPRGVLPSAVVCLLAEVLLFSGLLVFERRTVSGFSALLHQRLLVLLHPTSRTA